MGYRPGQPFAGLVSSILLLPGQPEGMRKRRISPLIASNSSLVQPLPDWNSLDLAGAFGKEVSPAVTGLVGHCTAAGSFFFCHPYRGMPSFFTHWGACVLQEAPCTK